MEASEGSIHRSERVIEEIKVSFLAMSVATVEKQFSTVARSAFSEIHLVIINLNKINDLCSLRRADIARQLYRISRTRYQVTVACLASGGR